jgi:hypothetical protein
MDGLPLLPKNQKANEKARREFSRCSLRISTNPQRARLRLAYQPQQHHHNRKGSRRCRTFDQAGMKAHS